METSAFIKEVADEVGKGRGFVPFVGAGFSAPSGVPLINELEGYLQRCLCIALRVDEKGDQESKDHQPWNPRTDQWPPLVDRNSFQDSGDWAALLLDKINSLRAIVAEDKNSVKPKDLDERKDFDGKAADRANWLKLYSEGFGAMQDWRTTLLFLSRLEMLPRGKEPVRNPPRLASPRPEVVDACFREVLRGRYPTLGHRMLGALAGALRIDLVLTTNFDDLLERAFETSRNPVDIFEVLLDGSLPRRTEIENHRTLVKLHGGRVALRADYSLDEAPQQQDKDQFLSYLMSAQGRNEYAKFQADTLNDPTINQVSNSYGFDKHLILLGFSGTDKRINQLVQEALARLKRDFKVYWLYYSNDDLNRLSKIYEGKETQVKLIKCTSSGFLLLELYQYLRNALPPLGSIFPSTSRLTLPPVTPESVKTDLDNLQNKDHFIMKLEDYIWKRDSDSHAKVIIAHAMPNVFGLTSVCVEVFSRLETSASIMAIWIDLNNVSSADNLYEVLLEAIYYKIGIEEWIPSTSESAAGENGSYVRRAEEFARLLNSVNKEWVFFLNAREKPGANTYEPRQEESQESRRNGWLDASESPAVDTANLNSFVRLIQDLCSKRALLEFPHPAPLTFVVVATNTDSTAITKPYTWAGINHQMMPLYSTLTDTRSLAECVRDNCLQWIQLEDSVERRRFLHALVLMQRPRFSAALRGPAFFDDRQDGSPSSALIEKSNTWIDDLETAKLVRKKPGGMIWMHSECRHALRQAFSTNADNDTGDIHVNIAVWYERAIDASDAPDAVFESSYHFCKAAQDFFNRREQGRAVSLVRAATAKIRSESYLIQTHGYSRGSCRQLERLADIGLEMWLAAGFDTRELPIEEETDSALRNELVNLWLACVETMRAIAREVGEDGKAFYRQRQVATLYGNATKQQGTEYYISWKTCRELPKIYKKNTIAGGHTTPIFERPLCRQVFSAHSHRSRARLWRWLRWTAMLHIASRAYQSAEIYLHGKYPDNVQGLGDLDTQAKGNFAKIVFDNDSREAIELLRMIEKAAELQLLRFGAEVRSKTCPEICDERLRNAENLIRRGLALSASIRDKDHTREAKDTVLANWCETRLLIHLSVVHARADECSFIPRLKRDPLGILSDAEAKLRVSNPQRTRADLALIDLHRAEVKLQSKELRDLEGLFDGLKNGNLPVVNENTIRDLRIAGASASDAIRFLDRAALVMRERRRNVWWTSWYFERKLKAIAYSVMSSCAEQGSPIPFLGLEAAMRLTDTEADRVLRDAQRMIRFDVYRMATVVDAYALCLISLVAKLASDNSIPRLPLRIDSMLSSLRVAVNQIALVREQRNVVRDLDDKVEKYSSEVEIRILTWINSQTFSGYLELARTSS